MQLTTPTGCLLAGDGATMSPLTSWPAMLGSSNSFARLLALQRVQYSTLQYVAQAGSNSAERF